MTSLKRALLKEETEFHNILLDIAGIVPGYGEYFDALNAIDYFRKGDYLLSTLSVISMLPMVGDLVGKGGKVAVWVERNFPKMFSAAVKYGPDAINAAKELRILVRKYKPLIVKLLDRIEYGEDYKSNLSGLIAHIPKIREVIDVITGEKTIDSNETDGSLKTFVDAVNKSEAPNNVKPHALIDPFYAARRPNVDAMHQDLMKFNEARLLKLAGILK